MDQCTHEVRLQHWKEIISQCQARPAGQTAKQWLEENGICEQSYYSWQRRIRQETYEQMKQEDRLPAPAKKKEVSFAEISQTVDKVLREIMFLGAFFSLL